MTRSVSRIRSKAMMRVEGPDSTKNSHHSSNFGSGKSGAWTGPIASPSLRFFRVSVAVTVAMSPTTISPSSSTSKIPFSSTLLMWEQKASMSRTCCGSIFESPFLCSGSLLMKASRLETAFFPLLACLRLSSLKCGICSSWLLFTSSACTKLLRNSIIACAVKNHSRMHAISTMAWVIFMACLSSWSVSSRSSSVMRWCRRCMCAQTRNWFFTMIGSWNWRFLCSVTCCAKGFICVLSVGRVGMLLLSADAASNSGQFLSRVDSLM
mmetsp:Transcript_71555/g.190316  ORF Transcript_71555/g.190316 Transcript_71555/m.190316 type:complete len:266 (+) Transcript_71555:533-1330(+)